MTTNCFASHESIAAIDLQKFASNRPDNKYAVAASDWYRFGFRVIPILSGTKIPAMKWDPWLNELSPYKIASHWLRNPNHELGFIVGDNTIVFDADSPESSAALKCAEKIFRVTPSLVVKTRKGQHHYFLLAQGVHARSDAHSTELHPERIDVKTGRALVVLPPSTGKTIELRVVATAGQLSEVSQEFIDAVALHNGRQPNRPYAPSQPVKGEPNSEHLHLLYVIIRHISANCGHDDWIHAGMALHHETGGSDDGLSLFDAWSKAGKTYKGIRETSYRWKSFRTGLARTYTIGTLYWMAKEAGVSRAEILAEAEPFPVCGGEDD